MRPALILAGIVALGGCGGCSGGPPAPAALDTRNDTCASCRMTVSEQRFSAQLVAPAEEPRFFDDIGCLRTYLADHPAPPPAAVAYVADHRTGAWVRAADALYTRQGSVETPMASHLLAHADAASRAGDPAVHDAPALSAAEVFGAGGPPAGEARQ